MLLLSTQALVQEVHSVDIEHLGVWTQQRKHKAGAPLSSRCSHAAGRGRKHTTHQTVGPPNLREGTPPRVAGAWGRQGNGEGGCRGPERRDEGRSKVQGKWVDWDL